MERNDVKITVLKTMENPEIFQEYAGEGVKPRCPLMEEGRVFVSEAMKMPEGSAAGRGQTSRGTWPTSPWGAASPG